MDHARRAQAARLARELVAEEVRGGGAFERVFARMGGFPTGMWYPRALLDGIEFDGDVSLLRGIWPDERVREIEAGADATGEEVREWRLAKARWFADGTDWAWRYTVIPLERDGATLGHALVVEPVWYSFDRVRPRPEVLGVFGEPVEALAHLRSVGVLPDGTGRA